MIIGLDFDGTCVKHEYPQIGEDIGAIPVLKQLIQHGHLIVLNTMRSNTSLDEAVQWFKDNEIPLYGINYNPEQGSWTSSPKVYAHLYIDDAALGVPLVHPSSQNERPWVDWIQVEQLLKKENLI